MPTRTVLLGRAGRGGRILRRDRPGYHRAVIGLVLAAAGSSTRFGPGTPKVLRPLGGKPVLLWSLEAFRRAVPGLAVVVTVRQEDRDAVEALARAHAALQGVTVVDGGATRQESVARGVAALPDAVEVVLVHDAARPLVTEALVRAVVDAVRRDGAAAPALPLTSTVHRADARGRLVEALEREGLRAVQTPQGARAGLLRRALALARERGTAATDEVGLLIAAGTAVAAVPGDPDNVKVTAPEDLAWAEERVRRRG
jgi:2-C-methyl-D-erythritol 4-phosphate cytidylyltransferase